MAQAIQSFLESTPLRVVIVGDTMLDRYVTGTVGRLSPEAVVPVLEKTETSHRLGGAAGVASILRGWGVSVDLIGVRGSDPDGDKLVQLLGQIGVDATHLHPVRNRCTTSKTRYGADACGRQQPLLRVDNEVSTPLKDVESELIVESCRNLIPQADLLLVSDYAKGVCTEAVLKSVLELASLYTVPVLVDPARGKEFGKYCGAQWLKPNRREAQLALTQPMASVAEAMSAASDILENQNAKVMITLDADGLVIHDGHGPLHVPGRRVETIDATGAGDAAFAALAVGVAAGASAAEVGEFVNSVASNEVMLQGVAPFPLTLLDRNGQENPKVVAAEIAAALAQQRRARGETIVFTNGCFDMLHIGHVQMLEEAAAFGDCLVVGVNSDASVRELKGTGRPVISETQRAQMLAALACVDRVVIFDAPNPSDLLHKIRPDVLVKGGTTQEVVGREFVESYGGSVKLTKEVNGISTTRLLAIAAKSERGEPC